MSWLQGLEDHGGGHAAGRRDQAEEEQEEARSTPIRTRPRIEAGGQDTKGRGWREVIWCSGSGLRFGENVPGSPCGRGISPLERFGGLPLPLTMDGGAGSTQHQVAHPPWMKHWEGGFGETHN